MNRFKVKIEFDGRIEYALCNWCVSDKFIYCLVILVFLVGMERRERLLRSGEVAEILGVDRHTVVKWIKEGKISAIRLPSGRYRIPESEVRRILEGRGN